MTTHGRPIISVAIATRNYGPYLPRALDSVFRSHNPTGVPIQVVVADDASTDDTHAILADYRRRYPKQLEVVRIRMPEGIGAAKNAALDRCRGRTVAILDSDDEFLPEKLARCHAVLEGGGVDMVTTDFSHWMPDGRLIPRPRLTWESWRTEENWFWPPSTWVFRNGVVRFNPHSLGAEDLEWMDRRWSLLRRRHLDQLLHIQHVHPDHYGQRSCSLSPASQLVGRMVGRPVPDDRLAPPAWSCRVCGNLYLLPARCCGQDAAKRPLLFYWTILSPYHPTRTEFSLVMLTRNRLDMTQRAVGSILARVPIQERRAVELIFVDGYSTDGTLEFIRDLAKTHAVKLILTHPAEPFNFSRACNRGVHAARGEYVLLLNNDIELRSENPWGPLRAAFQDPRVGVVGASNFWYPEQRDAEWTTGWLPAGSPPYLFVKRPLTGDFWGARREVYWELGGMDELFAGYGYDELDFEYRAQLAHYQLALARVRVHHELHATFEPAVGTEMMHDMGVENRDLFTRKHSQPVRPSGTQVEPFFSHPPPTLSLVMTTRSELPRLKETLARAIQDPRCHDGTLQLVVVDNASNDDTAVLLEEYRLRLPRCLNVISLPEPVTPARAEQIGRARCLGPAIRTLSPGEWLAAPGPSPGGACAPSAAQQEAPAPRPHVFAHSSGAAPSGAATSGSQRFDYPVTLYARTEHFNVYYQTDLGADGKMIADGVLRSCERDYRIMSRWFGGITPPGLPFNLILAALSPGRDGKGGAYHYGCAAVDLYEDVRTTPYPDADLSRMLVVAEAVEVFEAAQGGGWDCSASNGEGLSRVLSTALYPNELAGYETAAVWLDSRDRPDYVNHTAPTDRDQVANGCSVLFLNWLHNSMGYGWDQIAQAPAPTLAQTCLQLTGRGDGWTRFRAAIDRLFQPGRPSGLAIDNPYWNAPRSAMVRRVPPPPERVLDPH